ncbi:ABC transporter permease [Arthrobacter sp. UYCo732]|uniref:ABC transporter permease n=1 Tax=Arthrobacter sp. UYCo732 TaxID=3156336 RepID=UPI0033952AE2
MTTVTNTRSAGKRTATVPARLNFLRLLRAECIKLTSLRSSVILLLSSVAAMIGIGAVGAWGITMVLGQSSAMQAATDLDSVALAIPASGLVLGQLLIGSLAVIQVGSEYGTGLIRASFTASPRRISNVLAKTAVMAAAAFLTGLLGGLGSYLAAQPFLAGHNLGFPLTADGVIPSILNLGASLALVAIMAIGTGYLLRSSAAGITVTLGVLLVLPIVAGIAGMFNETILEMGRYLPSNAATQMVTVTTGSNDLTQGQGALVLLAWAFTPLLAGMAAVKSRDV